MKLEELLKKYRAQIKALTKKEDLSPEEAKELEGLMEKAETVKMQIKALGEVDAAEKLETEAAEKERKEELEAAVKVAEDKVKAEYAKKGRLPFKEGAPAVLQFSELSKYDHLDAADQALFVGVLNATDGTTQIKLNRASENAVKALAVKLSEDETRVGIMGQRAMKALGIKADEVMQQDLSGYGDEWVGVAYSQAIWDAIRVGTFVAEKIPSIEVPPGHESITLPLEGADPTYYKVAETTDHDSTSGYPVASVTSSKMATGSASLTLAKMGARVPWSGELEEDSLIPFVNQLRMQLQLAGAEQLEHAIIDGDTEAGASTNINDIAGTPAATDLFMMFDGFRKSCIITTSANSRDGGALADTDFIETVKLMGTAGINALDITKVDFIIDPNTHWKALELAVVKTKDVFSQPTIEKGKLTGIWGYPVNVSANMHYKATARKTDSAGKIDVDTQGNNTKGGILAVRWDQWLMGYRRRMTIETTRYPASDSTEIVALMRLGLKQRDTEASAISYNLTI